MDATPGAQVRNVLGCAARSAQRQSMRVAMDSARQRATTRPTPAAKNDDYDDCDNDDDSGLGELEEKLLTRLSLTSDDGESREPIKVGNSGARAFPVKSSCPIVVFQAGSNITINVSDPVIRDQAGHRHTFVQKRKPARSDSFEKAKVRSDAYGDEVSAQYPQNKHQFQESSHDSFSASDANSRSGLGSGLKYRAGSFSSFKSRSGSESRSGGTRSSSTSDSSASAGSRRSTGTAKKVRDSSHPGHFDILTRRRHPELQRHDPLDQERRSQSSLLKKHLRLPQKSSLNPQPPRLLTEGHSLEQERKAWTKKDIRLLCHLVELHIPGATEAQRARRRAEAERKVLKARQEVNLKTTGNSSASASKAVKKMQKEFQNHRTHTKVAVPPKPIIPWVEIARELKRTDAGCSAKWEQLIKKDLNTERLAALSEAAATAAAATAAAATAAAATAPSVHSPTRRVVARPTTVVDLEDVADVNTDAESISVMESESGSESDETNAA
ncbi:hypothetical protein EDD11_001453 [Mortierella claussenii]|nr:hypothetical protein EDD11_001453 [Mortierella claussenii]